MTSPPTRAAEDKSAYTLFNPTPMRLMRDYDPDRPGQSHDPTTVDAGHVEIETGGFEHVYDPRGPGATSTRRYIYANPTVRVGVTNWAEIQVSAPLHHLLRTGGSEVASARGVGDASLAAKINLLGNDSGDHLLALLPIVKFGTARTPIGNGFAEYTLAIPYNYDITKELALTLEPSFGALRNAANTGYRDSYGFIAGFDQRFAKDFIASFEVFTLTSTARKEATIWGVAPSLAYFLSRNLQLDGGINLGLNKATPRYNPYIGVSARF